VTLGPSYRKLFAASTISNLGDGVGLVAYPWLASAVTRNPVLIALVIVAQRLPWLVFTLPAGVITDRHDRRTIMFLANTARAAITALVALAVMWRGGDLPGPDELDTVVGTEAVLYICVLVATMLLGVGEVLYDNSAQTFMPRIVDSADLERANGRLYSAELVANQFGGPPIGAVLLTIGFAVPFVLDAASFTVSAALIFAIVATPAASAPAERKPWRAELSEGVRWLWHHELLRTLAIVLGLLNALGAMTLSIEVLFAQEVLGTSTTEFAALTMIAALGGVIGGWASSSVTLRIGPGPSLWLVLAGGGLATATIGLMSWWPVVGLLFGVYAAMAVLWNVITVSLRQTIIPDHLLGRVNSVYRFFGWGSMPIGALLGGAVVAIADAFTSREVALRIPFILAGACQLLVFVYAGPRLTTARIEAARAEPLAAV
jgi:MFS family permease